MYRRLNYEDYFIICSGICAEKPDLERAEYKSVEYRHRGHAHSAEYQVRYDEARDCIQAIFQATAGKSDWRANFEFPAKIYDEFTYEGEIIQLRVHGGWGDMWLAAQDSVRKEFLALLEAHPGADVEVFGWSLGSAMAQLAAEDLYFKFGVKPHLYTYGSVKPLFGKKTWEYCRSCCASAHNFYDHCDIVGYMVPLLGWRAIAHDKVRGERFCLTKLLKPQIYHCLYNDPSLYKGLD